MRENIGEDHLKQLIDSDASVENIQSLKELLSSVSSVICILNRQNKIIFANDKLIEKYNLDIERDVVSLRFGEILNCTSKDSMREAYETGGFSGASHTLNDFWKYNETVINECSIILEVEGYTEQIDLQVKAVPFHADDDYMILSVVDISEKRRREILERIFFHDIINMAGSLSGILSIIQETHGAEDNQLINIANSLSDELIDGLEAQRQMLRAEMGILQISAEKIKMKEFLQGVRDKVKYCQAAFERKIRILDSSSDVEFTTDKTLLTRVVFNMAKNALEAIGVGEEILLEALDQGDRIRIEVHNDTWIEEKVSNQLFQRLYSTKGKNRGLGTYSMKLLGEKYLKGVVNFQSNPEKGTTFFIEIPVTI